MTQPGLVAMEGYRQEVHLYLRSFYMKDRSLEPIRGTLEGLDVHLHVEL